MLHPRMKSSSRRYLCAQLQVLLSYNLEVGRQLKEHSQLQRHNITSSTVTQLWYLPHCNSPSTPPLEYWARFFKPTTQLVPLFRVSVVLHNTGGSFRKYQWIDYGDYRLRIDGLWHDYRASKSPSWSFEVPNLLNFKLAWSYVETSMVK